jgi:fatty acid desaturase
MDPVDDVAHYADALTNQELAALVVKRDAPGLARFAMHYGLFLATAAAAVFADDEVVRVVAAFGCAPLWSGLFATMHETMHGTAFRTRALNEIGLWLSALPIFFVPTPERELHFEHHRFTHDPARDPELSVDGENLARGPRNLAEWLGLVSGLPLILARAVMLPSVAFGLHIALKDVAGVPKLVRLPWLRPRHRVRAVIEAWLCIAIYVAIAIAAWAHDPTLRAYAELAVAFVVGQAMLAVYQQCEHRGLHPSGDIFARTRSLNTFAIVRLVYWNMPWHAEHHAYPAVPFHALGALHEKLAPRLVHKDDGFAALTLRSLQFKKRLR